MLVEKQKLHFIGIGGIGMSGIARILLSLGCGVSGSDMRESEITEKLEAMGAKIFIGHNSENISDDIDAVVTSTAIPATNPEIIEAKKKGIIIIHRSEMLAEIMRLRYGIAVSGTHGKTTTTSLVSHLLIEGGLSPTSVIGGKHFNIDSNANLGKSNYLVCEADESDGSFIRLSPVIAIVTNIDNDHLDHYKTEEALRMAFLKFMNSVPFYGFSFICFEDETIRDLSKDLTKKFYSYGFSNEYDLYAENIKAGGDGFEFDAIFEGTPIGRFKTPLLGKHNVLNTLAAIGVAKVLGIENEKSIAGLKNFKGVGRRLNLIYNEDIQVYDDYGHHPTEIQATVSALKEAKAGSKIIAVFQPHRYSRTENLFEEFGRCFFDADEVVITDIYAAGEQPKPGISGKTIYDSIKKNGQESVHYVEDKNDIPAFLKGITKSGDTVITLGAGDINKIGARFVSEIQ